MTGAETAFQFRERSLDECGIADRQHCSGEEITEERAPCLEEAAAESRARLADKGADEVSPEFVRTAEDTTLDHILRDLDRAHDSASRHSDGESVRSAAPSCAPSLTAMLI